MGGGHSLVYTLEVLVKILNFRTLFFNPLNIDFSYLLFFTFFIGLCILNVEEFYKAFSRAIFDLILNERINCVENIPMETGCTSLEKCSFGDDT